ncbi:uncharacterized protein [Lolium perenne]|uniref:uncharacterized protein n=1 Tax=Lolium perenne TaxID=4522 RepID=UPI003A9980E2
MARRNYKFLLSWHDLVQFLWFAKIKLDVHVFLGNWLQVSYAPQFERFLDTKEKSEVRRNEVHGQIRSNKIMDLSYENKAEPAQLEKTQELLDKHIVRIWQCPNSALAYFPLT